jgi:putative transposase
MPDWPHAPIHRIHENGTYMVTAGTYHKRMLFDSDERRQLLHDALLEIAREYGWKLEAWAVLANHYHVVAHSPDDPDTLRRLVSKLHALTAKAINQIDGTPGRRVWFQYWDSQITYQRSYLARLKYVHYNPERHGVTAKAAEYPWCSAGWFQRTARPSFRKTVMSFKVDRVVVKDDF